MAELPSIYLGCFTSPEVSQGQTVGEMIAKIEVDWRRWRALDMN
jgi:hypothetical protein